MANTRQLGTALASHWLCHDLQLVGKLQRWLQTGVQLLGGACNKFRGSWGSLRLLLPTWRVNLLGGGRLFRERWEGSSLVFELDCWRCSLRRRDGPRWWFDPETAVDRAVARLCGLLLGARGASATCTAKTPWHLYAHIHEPRAWADRIVVVRRVGNIDRVSLVAFHPVDCLLL